MILIKKIEFYQTERDVEKVVHDYYDSAAKAFPYEPIDRELVVEVVRGNKYRNPKTGEEVVLGVTDEVSRILGISYEAWENREVEHMAEMRNLEVDWAEKLLRFGQEIENYGFFKRLKFLFTGKI